MSKVRAFNPVPVSLHGREYVLDADGKVYLVTNKGRRKVTNVAVAQDVRVKAWAEYTEDGRQALEEFNNKHQKDGILTKER